MLIILILSCSILLQLGAAVFALRLIKISGRAFSWMAISLALILMSIRRIIPLYHFLILNKNYTIDIFNETVGLGLSLLMYLGMSRIKFIFIDRQNALNESKNLTLKLDSILSADPNLVIEINSKKICTWINKAGFEFFGYEIWGSNLLNHFIDNSQVNTIIEKLLSGCKGVQYFEAWQRRKDGQKRFLAYWCTSVAEKEGKTQSIILTGRDITENITSQTEITHLATFPRLNPNPICEVDLNGNIVYQNPAALALKDQGLDCPCHFTPQELKEVYSKIKKNIKVQEVKSADKWYLQTIQFIPDNQNIRFYNVDITDRKKLENLLLKDKDTLDKLVQEKTLELVRAQKDLVDKKRLSDIGVLAATIAHELRNPLGVIKAAVYNISRKTKEASIGSHLANIEKKIEESDQIIKNLLGYSRMRIPHFESIEISSILKNCVNQIKEKYLKWNIEVSFQFDPSEKFIISADPLQLQELFTNIIDNAYQAFPDKIGSLKINIQQDTARNNLELVFSDNGIGISEETIDKIFNPFFTNKARGIGLGLTVCKQIVELHDGSINIESKKGQGTKVHINLPIKKNV